MPRNTLGDLHKAELPPNFLREWRQHRGMTQKELAAIARTTNATVSRIENRQQPFTSHTLQRFSAVLKCTPRDLLNRGPGAPEQDDDPEVFLRQLAPEQRKHALDVLKTVFKKQPE